MSADVSIAVVGVVGTAGPFDRLVQGLAAWRAAHPDGAAWVQHGDGALPGALEGAALIPRAELLAKMAAADVVVCHAGSGTIGDALACGHTPVVMPRLARFGEHLNDHQLEMVEGLGCSIIPVLDVSELPAAIEEARHRRRSGAHDNGAAQLAAALRADLGVLSLAGVRRPLWSAPAWAALRALARVLPVKRY